MDEYHDNYADDQLEIDQLYGGPDDDFDKEIEESRAQLKAMSNDELISLIRGQEDAKSTPMINGILNYYRKRKFLSDKQKNCLINFFLSREIDC